MTQYIDKSAIIAKIEKKINSIDLDTIEDWRYRLQWEHDIEVMKNVISLIDTLEIKEIDFEKEPISEDLDEAALQYAKDYLFTPAAERDLRNHFIAGAQWQKEQMIKDVIDSEVKWCNYGYPDFPIEDLAVLDEIVLPKDKFQIGDKVKVIIITQ